MSIYYVCTSYHASSTFYFITWKWSGGGLLNKNRSSIVALISVFDTLAANLKAIELAVVVVSKAHCIEKRQEEWGTQQTVNGAELALSTTFVHLWKVMSTCDGRGALCDCQCDADDSWVHNCQQDWWLFYSLLPSH